MGSQWGEERPTPLRLTPLGVIVVIFLAMWAASAAGYYWSGEDDVRDSSTQRSTGKTAAVEGAWAAPSQAAAGAVMAAPTPAARASRGGHRSSLVDTTCYVWTGSRTASGKWPRVGMAASNRYPFGTVLHIQGVGRVVVEDRIGHGSSLDIFLASRSACLRFGRQQLHVSVVR